MNQSNQNTPRHRFTYLIRWHQMAAVQAWWLRHAVSVNITSRRIAPRHYCLIITSEDLQSLTSAKHAITNLLNSLPA